MGLVLIKVHCCACGSELELDFQKSVWQSIVQGCFPNPVKILLILGAHQNIFYISKTVFTREQSVQFE